MMFVNHTYTHVVYIYTFTYARKERTDFANKSNEKKVKM